MIAAITAATLRALLARRRFVLMLLLTGIPVLIGLVARLRGVSGDPSERAVDLLEPLVIATLLPIVALVFGTAALGAEIEDGSAIHLLTKPVARWRIVAAKILGAAPVTAFLTAGATLLTGLLLSGGRGGLEVTLALTVGVAVGSALYVALFVALSVLTTRALIIGLAYVAIWEGMLAGLFEGTRVLSIRQYVLSIVAALDPSGAVGGSSMLETGPAILGAAVVLVAAFLVAVRRLEAFQITAGD